MNSNLQVISGAYHGRKLFLPDGARPTQNRARAAVFNMLAGILTPGDEIFAWDAFGGSGAMGIETLSRYDNSRVIFTDTSDKSIKSIQKNTTGIAANRICITKTDATKVIKNHVNTVNLIFVDPPYEDANVGISFVATLGRLAVPGTIVVQEIENTNQYTPDGNKWDILRDKVYGRARFIILRKKK
ncbi:MAG: RsmD family RNA methyltransferase [Alphaproteobacteria bacterium]|nr:RsmD family RNA methyltransferase [Alphaproteobacteria bacterium]